MFSLSNVTCWTALALKYSNCFAGKKNLHGNDLLTCL